jgi:hypothetical protein
VCVAPSLQLIFYSKLATFCQFVHSFALQRLPIFILLGRVPNEPLDFANLFQTCHNVSRRFDPPVAAAATAQVKLCPYDEEELHIWFRLNEAQFSAAGIKSQKLKYANTLASLPKQVLRDILDTLDVCNDSPEPFNFLKIPCLDSLERASGKLTLNRFAFPWKCRASSPVFLWESSNNISLQEYRLTMTFFFQCF